MTRREQMICGLLEGGRVMHEILFHGKRTDNGEWVEGAYMPYYYSTRYGKVAAIFTNDDVLCKTCRYPVDPSTVGQYVGLKDKNGKRIFEGDILSIPFEEDRSPYEENSIYYEKGEVYFDTERYGWYVRFHEYNDEISLWEYDNTDIEVISNIYDNPELLKGGNQ